MRRRSGSIPWYSSITRAQWKTLAAAQFAWMLDAMDVMLYAFALTTIRDEFRLSSAAAGALVYAILIYSGFTGLTATATGVASLLVWRTLVGTGMGGVWSAGSVLVAESWPAEHRGKAASGAFVRSSPGPLFRSVAKGSSECPCPPGEFTHLNQYEVKCVSIGGLGDNAVVAADQ